MTTATTEAPKEEEVTESPPATDIVLQELNETALQVSAAHTEASMLMDPKVFEHVQRVAKVYAASDIVPTQFKGNVANCVIMLELSYRMKTNVFMLMQNSYVVHGRPGFEAKLAISLANQRGPFRGPIQYKYTKNASGKIIACSAYAHHKNGELFEATIDEELVKAEGWLSKPGSKWKTMPEQMYAYRSAVFLIRKVCPEVLLGMPTNDELIDVYGDTRYVDSTSTPTRGAAGLAEKLKPSTPEAARPEEPTPEADDATGGGDASGEPSGGGEPEPWYRLVVLLSDKTNAGGDACHARIARYASKMHGKDPSDLNVKELAALEGLIKSGVVTVEK